MMGNRMQEKAMKIGDLPVTMHDMHGDSCGGAVLQGVQILLTGKFNLISVMKLLKKGCPAEDSKEIVFDKKIPTSEGVLFTMYMTHRGEVVNAAMMTGDKKKISRCTGCIIHCPKKVRNCGLSQSLKKWK